MPTGIRAISLLSTKSSNDLIDSLVELTYNHFVVHSIVVTGVLLVVLIPSNLIDNSAVYINVRDTSGKSRTIATRILHRGLECLSARFPT